MKLTREKLRRIIISEMAKIMRPTMAQVQPPTMAQLQPAYDDEDEETEDEETEDDFLHDYLEMVKTGEFHNYPYDYPDNEEDKYGGFSKEYYEMIRSRPYDKD